MVFTSLARSFALLVFAALWSAGAFALSETYEGLLVPSRGEPPISIAVQLEEMGGFLSGKMKIGSPLTGNASIDNGRNVAGSCNFSSVLSSSATIRFSGSCSSSAIEGIYVISYTKTRAVARGTFRLTRKVADKGKAAGGMTGSASSVAACLKANTRCLTGCPRGDTSVEYLCANRCRTKLQTCKANASKEIEASQ